MSFEHGSRSVTSTRSFFYTAYSCSLIPGYGHPKRLFCRPFLIKSKGMVYYHNFSKQDVCKSPLLCKSLTHCAMQLMQSIAEYYFQQLIKLLTLMHNRTAVSIPAAACMLAEAWTSCISKATGTKESASREKARSSKSSSSATLRGSVMSTVAITLW